MVVQPQQSAAYANGVRVLWVVKQISLCHSYGLVQPQHSSAGLGSPHPLERNVEYGFRERSRVDAVLSLLELPRGEDRRICGVGIQVGHGRREYSCGRYTECARAGAACGRRRGRLREYLQRWQPHRAISVVGTAHTRGASFAVARLAVPPTVPGGRFANLRRISQLSDDQRLPQEVAAPPRAPVCRSTTRLLALLNSDS